MQTVKAAYQQFCDSIQTIYGEGEARSIARIVFEDVFTIFSFSSTASFSDENLAQLKTIEHRLIQHEPIQYILGQADFYGLKFKVNPDVLIPRQETEELVALIIETVGQSFSGRILDIGTGSGCIPITLKKYLPNAQVIGLDVSAAALRVATENASHLNQNVEWIQQDILNKEQWKTLDVFDIIVSNPPYIPRNEADKIPKWVLTKEPQIALFVENDNPLLFYETITAFSHQHLKNNGYLFFELNEFNAKAVYQLAVSSNFETTLHRDLNGKNRMLRAEKI